MARSERGANLVEAALVVPILILVLVGLVDLGGAFISYNAIANGAREGARYGARRPTTSEFPTIKSIALAEATNGAFLISGCSADEPFIGNDSSGRFIRVAVQCQYNPILPGLGPYTLRNQTTMKIEGP